MPILQRFDNARVLMYLDDHPPPHVHIKLREALVWIEARRDFLYDEWQGFNP